MVLHTGQLYIYIYTHVLHVYRHTYFYAITIGDFSKDWFCTRSFDMWMFLHRHNLAWFTAAGIHSALQAVGLSRIDWRKVVSHLRARSVSHCFWLFCIRYILVMDHFSLLCAGFCWYMFYKDYILLSAFIWWYQCKLVGANVLFVHLFIFEGNICCHLDRGILPRWTGAFCSEPGYVSNGVGKIMNNGVRMEDRSNS